MSDTPSTDPTPAAKPSPSPSPSPARAWRDAWQIPLLVIGAGGVAAAIWFGTARKPANDFEGALDQAEKYIEGRDIPVARKILDEVVAPHIAGAPEEFVHRYEALRADFAAEELAERKDGSQADHEAVAKLYETALAHGADLDDRQYARYANALEGAKRNSDAIAAAEKAGDHDRARKLEVRFGRKRVEDAFEAARAANGSRTAAAETDKFFKEHEAFRSLRRISADDRAWAAGLAARLRLASGRVADATDRLLVELRLAERASQVGDIVSRQEFAQLWYLLGEGFRQQDKFSDAEHALEQAHELAQRSSLVAGEIDLALGRTKLALDRAEDAHEIFDRGVQAEHPAALKQALTLGRANARALLGDIDDALRDFDTLVALSEKGALSPSVAGESLRTLNSLARNELGDEKYPNAIAFAQRATAFGSRDVDGANAFITLAESCYRQAQLMRAAAIERSGSPTEIDPEDRAEINAQFSRAGKSYSSYLETDSAKDLPAVQRSMLHFSAADGFECAGDLGLALMHFARATDILPEGDSKRTESYLRMGNIYSLRGEYDKAKESYERVYKITRNDPRVAMPLCRALVASRDTAGALAQLKKILEGGAGLRPDSEQYQEALDLYAKLAFDRGDFVASAERLRELVDRNPNDVAVGERQFRLGLSLQQIAKAARDEASRDDLTGSRRSQVERAASDRTLEAQRAFQSSIDALEGRGRALDGLGRDMLRNAYLQRAHCAFDRAQYKEAIDFYETVDRKYADSASSVVALVQIVNAADAMGDLSRAEAAHTRALRRIESLPDQALVGDGGILAREDWKTWLRNHPPGATKVAGATEQKQESHR